ncbi:MAG: shikimate kinase [Coriobacteriales bacterium]|nr:shikimate kinase [Coriobacteriales bacterium]
MDTHEEAPFGLLGRTLGHSWSVRIHNALGSQPYALFEREPNQVEEFVRTGSWRGINVTIPYKRQAAQLADERTERVQRLGVSNTLVRMNDGRILADNTDVLGFSWMLERFCRRSLGQPAAELLPGEKALVLGSGGASQAVQAALADAGMRVVVVSRSGPQTYEDLTQRHADATLVVNTTPVGMFPNCPKSVLSRQQLEALGQLRGVLDVVYNPERTGLCLLAEQLGIACESGLAMLVSQAKFASELFLDTTHPNDVVERIEDDIRAQTRNVILIGMPGCGKSSAGRRLAHLAHRPFVDLDDSFSVDHGTEPGAYIRANGEDAFRRLETQTAATYAAQSGLVIACGGGIVTREENYELLHQNGTIIMLDRPLAELSSDGRPLSQSKGVERLARERMHRYRSWADHVLPCTGSAQGDAEAICGMLGL